MRISLFLVILRWRLEGNYADSALISAIFANKVSFWRIKISVILGSPLTSRRARSYSSMMYSSPLANAGNVFLLIPVRAARTPMRISFGRVFRKAGGRHQTTAHGLKPAAPVGRRQIANVGNRRTTELWRRRHAPAHSDQLAAALVIADHGCLLVRKYAWHARQIAGAIERGAEQPPDRLLISGHAVEIAHGGSLARSAAATSSTDISTEHD
jgi:hypothetical protein